MGKKKYKDYRDFLMKEKLSPITIGHMEVTKEQKGMVKAMREETMKKVNKQLKELKLLKNNHKTLTFYKKGYKV
ncbi:MAG: hypothetical protein HFG40_00350 [Bacilli bacterium]|nr:hypothetical protein [Bacilli bacterium]